MKKNIFIVVGAILVLILGAFAIFYFSIKPTGSKGEIVESSGNVNELSVSLTKKGVIRSPLIFRLLWGNSEGPEEGYYIVAGTNLRSIVEMIKEGPNVTKVTFPEGFSLAQIAQRLGNRGWDAQAIYEAGEGNEGKLFPDTYFFKNFAPAQEIITTLTSNYETRTKNINPSEQDIIIASIVEREAKNDEERLKIATVYKNRLKLGMKLEADPTVQYARDKKLINDSGLKNVEMWQPLFAGETRSVISPFNTYLNGGLPPSPICNPGLKSIEAAMNEHADFEYLFFFHDKNGDIRFSKTYNEHRQLIVEHGVSGT